jgi:hypothetical protein
LIARKNIAALCGALRRLAARSAVFVPHST